MPIRPTRPLTEELSYGQMLFGRQGSPTLHGGENGQMVLILSIIQLSSMDSQKTAIPLFLQLSHIVHLPQTWMERRITVNLAPADLPKDSEISVFVTDLRYLLANHAICEGVRHA